MVRNCFPTCFQSICVIEVAKVKVYFGNGCGGRSGKGENRTFTFGKIEVSGSGFFDSQCFTF